MKKSAIRIGCFLIILVAVLSCFNSVFRFKYGDGIYGLTKFYELEDDTADVLILGTSHAFENINTGTLWDEHGIASFLLAGSIQPMWNTYYYFKEALKSQSPRLVVLEAFCTVLQSDYIDDVRIIKNTFGLHWSKDKIESIKVSAPQDRWPEFFLEYSQYHMRYKEISREDFMKDQGNPLYRDWKGFGCSMETNPLERLDVSGVTERKDLHEKTEKYYRAILELARAENIPMAVVVVPYAGITVDEQAMLNRAGDIASEYEIPFLNYNTRPEETGLDFSTDAVDAGHLNYKGNRKFTHHLGNDLAQMFELPDRRGDDRYISWQNQADYIRQMIHDQELKECTDTSLFFDILNNGHYHIFVSLDGGCSTENPEAREALSRLGIRDENAEGIWYTHKNEVVWHMSGEGVQYYRMAPHDIRLSRKDDGSGTGELENEVLFDLQAHQKTESGINLLVYDDLTEKIADCVGLNVENELAIVR